MKKTERAFWKTVKEILEKKYDMMIDPYRENNAGPAGKNTIKQLPTPDGHHQQYAERCI